MVSRDPDVTRLIDRLVRKGLVRRERDERDRRVVRIYITAEGRARLAQGDRLVARVQDRATAGPEVERLAELIDVLVARARRARGGRPCG